MVFKWNHIIIVRVKMRLLTIRVLALVSTAAIAMMLSGCLGSEKPVALATSGEVAPPQIPVKTVKQVQKDNPAGDVVAAGDPLPTAAQIFDFHPPGTKADTWRQPFIITDNEGPLVAYRNQTAAMLKELQDPNFQQTLPQPHASSLAGVH